MKGVYVLLVELRESAKIVVGKLGIIHFPDGYYAYVGSALNGLEGRIDRHLRAGKKTFWHIDYLLAKASIKEVIFAETLKRRECDIADSLGRLNRINHFGSSDCRCESHLFFSKNYEEVRDAVLKGFKESGLKPDTYRH
ncbi:MAG: GIY-YIG nuclease family protein [Halobacteriota archaeon]|nr:GIY-YIG nuclease family protein [Halobacteriota archaeon]